MNRPEVSSILEFAQGLDLHGRSNKLATALQNQLYEEALSLCEAALLDSEEMTKPNRTVFRRNVHEKNQKKLKELRAQIERLLK